MLRSLGIKQPSGAYDQIFITVRQLWVCWCGALCLTRGRVCRLQLLLALASAVILGSQSGGTHDDILLSQIQNFPFRRFLRLAGLRWRYSTPPPHRIRTNNLPSFHCILSIWYDTGRIENTAFNSSSVLRVYSLPLEGLYRAVAQQS
jgi:hypothetical protein